MQEVIVFMLFFGVVSIGVYRVFRKNNSDGCAHCEFNDSDG